MAWHGSLSLSYRRDGARTVGFDRHDGPLRVLKSLYPEGPGVCHSVLVHPPGGIVGGDRLAVGVEVGAGAHALVTTPGATRFYRSLGETARQDVTLAVAEGGRLEWLPLETLAYSGCLGETHTRITLAPGGEAMGWDVLALGLPASGQAFESGAYVQHVEVPGTWLERARIAAADRRLLDSPLGWDGQRVLATLWFVAGAPLEPARRDALLEAARAVIDEAPGAAPGMAPGAVGGAAARVPRAGATSPEARVVVVRALAPRVEPAQRLLGAVWARWRSIAWDLPACVPRVWRT